MSNQRLAAIVILGGLVLAVLLTAGPPAPSPNAPGTFAFAALGDAPYYLWEDLKYPAVLKDIRAHDVTSVLHVGDIFWRPCSDAMYTRSLEWFNGLGRPVIYTPGDNEWYDCWERQTGGYAPRERLLHLREVFFATPARSLGARPISLETQAADPRYPEFVENARWTDHGLVFATMHVIGSRNGMEAFPKRDAEDDAASRRRTEAAASWLRATFAQASRAPAVILAFHANAGLEDPPGDTYRQAFEPFITALEEEAERFARSVLVIHGDGHVYTVDRPLVRRTTGRLVTNLTRVQVPGSPDVGWLRVAVRPGDPVTFSFERRLVPRWKVW